MITERKAANALSGKTARACDGCSRRRARWFCAADDAFLCQSCDESVHSANQLASRHERVRLEYASFKTNDCLNTANYPPAWHQGFTKKARTPRYNFHKSLLLHQQFKDEEKVAKNPLLLVPEIGGEESVDEEDEDQLLYRVPVFDPFAAELCIDHIETPEGTENDDGNMVFDGYGEQEKCDNLDNLPGFLPSDMDLAQFAADVENLLGSGLDEDSTDIKNLGLINCKEEDDDKKLCLGMEKIVKVKDEQEMEAITGCQFDQVFDMERESLDWNLNYESSITGDDEEEEAKVVPVADDAMMNRKEKIEIEKRSSLLRLNYDGVITAWASQGSPWTTGSRPQLNPDDCWPDCVGAYHKDGHYIYGGTTCGNKGAREARVLRYKEKRRTRLFSKKIRYEVRKLNAEKRPRMKGRFVKRTCLVPTVFPYINKK